MSRRDGASDPSRMCVGRTQPSLVLELTPVSLLVGAAIVLGLLSLIPLMFRDRSRRRELFALAVHPKEEDWPRSYGRFPDVLAGRTLEALSVCGSLGGDGGRVSSFPTVIVALDRDVLILMEPGLFGSGAVRVFHRQDPPRIYVRDRGSRLIFRQHLRPSQVAYGSYVQRVAGALARAGWLVEPDLKELRSS